MFQWTIWMCRRSSAARPKRPEEFSTIFYRGVRRGGRPIINKIGKLLRQARELLSQLPHFGFESLVIMASIGNHRAQSGVKFSRSRFLHYASNVGIADACAGHDGDAVSRRCDEFGKYGSAFKSTRGPTGRQNPARAGLHDIFECFAQIRAIVECAMKGGWQRPRDRDEFTRSPDVHQTIFCQDAQYHPVYSCLLGVADGALHLCKFALRIDEVSPARPDHSEDRNVQLLAYRPHQFDAGCHSSDTQVSAELDTIRAPAPRGQRRLQCLDADFQQVSLLHFCSPEKRCKRVSVP